jgi:hypothetical protein
LSVAAVAEDLAALLLVLFKNPVQPHRGEPVCSGLRERVLMPSQPAPRGFNLLVELDGLNADASLRFAGIARSESNPLLAAPPSGDVVPRALRHPSLEVVAPVLAAMDAGFGSHFDRSPVAGKGSVPAN